MANEQPKEEKHVLICTLGESTEVVTEVLDKLLDEKHAMISEVALIHTAQGKILYGGDDYIATEGPSGMEAVPIWVKAALSHMNLR